MRTLIIAAALAVASPAAAFAQAAPTPPASIAPAAPVYTVAGTDIGTLIDTPETKAVLDKYLPGFTANEQIAMARSLTLKSLQQYTPDTMTDEALAKIDADLAKIPAKT